MSCHVFATVLLTVLSFVASGCSRQLPFSQEEFSFLARYPEVNLKRIPPKHRIAFMDDYEEARALRPQLDGRDVYMWSSSKEEITQLRLQGYNAEVVGDEIAIPDGVLIPVRLNGVGASVYRQAAKGFADEVVKTFLESISQ